MGDYVSLDEIVLPQSGDYVSLDEIAGPATSSRTASDIAPRLAQSILNGMTFGLGDEIGAFTRSRYHGTTYNDELSNLRQLQKGYESDHPYVTTGLEIGGGIATAPLTGAGIGKLAPALVTAPATVGQAIKQGAALGGVFGGAYGFGSGEDGLTNRLLSGAGGATTGAVVSSALTPAVYKIAQALSTRAARNPGATMPNLVADEAGSIQAPAAAEPALSKADVYLGKRIADWSPEQLQTAKADLDLAAAENSPQWLADNAPSLQKLVKYLGSKEAGTDTVRGAVEGRVKGSFGRIETVLDNLSSERSAIMGGDPLVNAVSAKAAALEDARNQVGEVLYGQAKGLLRTGMSQQGRSAPSFFSKEVNEAVKDPYVQDAIKQVGKKFLDFEGLPVTSFDVLQKAKEAMDARIRGILAAPDESQSLIEKILPAKNRLVAAMDSELEKRAVSVGSAGNPYFDARKGYEAASLPIDDFAKGPAKKLLLLDKSSSEKAGEKLFGLNDERIIQLKKELGEDGVDAIKAAARSYLQQSIEKPRANRDIISNIVDRPAVRKRIKAVMGDGEQYDNLMRMLDREATYAKAHNAYGMGSPTFSNQDEERALRGAMPQLIELLAKMKQPAMSAVNYITRMEPSDEVVKRLAEILTDTGNGRQFLERIGPVQAQARTIKADALLKSIKPAGISGIGSAGAKDKL